VANIMLHSINIAIRHRMSTACRDHLHSTLRSELKALQKLRTCLIENPTNTPEDVVSIDSRIDHLKKEIHDVEYWSFE
jgi:hypothetical protein